MLSKIKRVFRISWHFVKLGLAKCIAPVLKIFSPNYKNLWIIAERGDDARDNAWFFYKYMKNNHPEINIRYVITKASADYPKVAELGEPVEHNSFAHYICYAACKVRISSSMWGGDLPSVDYFNKTRRYMSKKRKFVFLKHGIIKDYLPQHCREAGSPNLYVCGAKPEYDFVLERFGHGERVTQYTGLARFDNLHDVETKNQILFMPTFRKWLQKMTPSEVETSEYVKAWNEALADERLIYALKANNLELIFYPHYVMQKHVDMFVSNDEHVKIARFKDYDVQTLLIESKLLVTDFSSVFFDFGYMKKPTVYYQFDRERYIKEHYDFTQGYFSYDDNGFGEVVFDKDELVNSVIAAIERNFALEPLYENRICEFFPLHDKNNCERIFKRIQELLK